MSDNGYSVNYESRRTFGSELVCPESQGAHEFPLEVLECFEAFRRRFNDVILPLKYRASSVTGQHADSIADFPSGSADDAQAGVGVRLQ